jgi:prepilin-type N-terminal cleavage/methylation domain-containing protein
MRDTRRAAFTLIELLVVIAIISLLVSILLPSLNRAKQLAKRTVCAMNLKGIHTASVFYAEDYDQYVVGNIMNPGGKVDGMRAGDWVAGGLGYYGGWEWHWSGPDTETRYTGKRPEGIFACPSGTAVVTNAWDTSDYQQNLNTCSSQNNAENMVRFDDLVAPDRTYHLCDGDSRDLYTYRYNQWRLNPDQYPQNNPFAYHDGVTNMLWFAGNVSTLTEDTFGDPTQWSVIPWSNKLP